MLHAGLDPVSETPGVTVVALFMMHGAIYLVMKTEGALQDRARGWVGNAIILFVICYASLTMVTLVFVPRMAERFRDAFEATFEQRRAAGELDGEVHALALRAAREAGRIGPETEVVEASSGNT